MGQTVDLRGNLRPDPGVAEARTAKSEEFRYIVAESEDGFLDRAMAAEVARELAVEELDWVQLVSSEKVLGFVSLGDLVRVLPAEDLVPNIAGSRSQRGQFGDPSDVPPSRYECRICSPPTVRFMRHEPSEPPLCPRIVTHGRMHKG